MSYLYTYVLFPFAPLTMIVIAVGKSSPGHCDMQVTHHGLCFSLEVYWKPFPAPVSWGVVDSSELRMLGCRDLDSFVLSKNMEVLCLHTAEWALPKFQAPLCTWQAAAQASALSHLPCTPGFIGGLQGSWVLWPELGLQPYGSLLSAALWPQGPCPGSLNKD